MWMASHHWRCLRRCCALTAALQNCFCRCVWRSATALVQRGAIAIGKTSRIGLRELMQVAGVRPPILPEDIGYRLGPRLNAAGRLSTAEKSLRLLLTDDDGEATILAAELDRENRERQEVERQIFNLAIEQIEGRLDA